MMIGKERIKGLVQRNIASGLAYYWSPDPAERRNGWKAIALGSDLSGAIKGAKARNQEVVEWKLGGARPKTVQKFIDRSTFGALLKRYREEKLAKLSANSQRVDKTQINRLEEWAGDMQISWITRARVKALRDALAPTGEGDPGHGVAFKTLAKGRDIFAWAMDEDIVAANPFERFNLAKPDPRQFVWEPEDLVAFEASADALGWHSVAFAVRLGTYTGQREADILKLKASDWKEITLRQLRFDQPTFDALKSDHGPDAGKVMGIRIKQNKGNRWIGSPIEGRLRDEIEKAIAAALERAKQQAATTAANLVAHDETGRPWGQRDFIDKVAAIRTHAIGAAKKAGDNDLADRLAVLQFRDLRRTCVVTLGELGMDDAAISAITGHKLATIKTILETYMPRTEAMAARGVVARIGIGHKDKKANAAEIEEKTA